MATYKAVVLGTIWMPAVTASYEYTFERDWKPTSEDIDTIAGDFQSVEDYQLYKRETCPCCGQSYWKLVKDWRNEKSELAYMETISAIVGEEVQ